PVSGSSKKPNRKKRSGSEKRQRTRPNTFRSTYAERDEMNANAAAVGLKFGGFMRSLGCTKPTTRAMPHVTPDRAAVNEFLGRVGKYEGNLYQVVRRMNFGDLPELRTLRELADDAHAFLEAARIVLKGA
ncbi:MAG: plasmid mobilization protein, partial [Terriglobia bacterium]